MERERASARGPVGGFGAGREPRSLAADCAVARVGSSMAAAPRRRVARAWRYGMRWACSTSMSVWRVFSTASGLAWWPTSWASRRATDCVAAASARLARSRASAARVRTVLSSARVGTPKRTLMSAPPPDSRPTRSRAAAARSASQDAMRSSAGAAAMRRRSSSSQRVMRSRRCAGERDGAANCCLAATSWASRSETVGCARETGARAIAESRAKRCAGRKRMESVLCANG
jgi:hypothetical protein